MIIDRNIRFLYIESKVVFERLICLRDSAGRVEGGTSRHPAVQHTIRGRGVDSKDPVGIHVASIQLQGGGVSKDADVVCERT